MNLNLTDQVPFIAGSSRGIGRAIAAALLASLTTACFAQSSHEGTSAEQASLNRFLEHGFLSKAAEHSRSPKYAAAFVDLNDDGADEVVVWLTDPSWCGSGGCTTLVLAPADATYRVVTKITTTRCPIRLLATRTHGWSDLGVQVQGGGMIRAYEAKLTFDGKTYPLSPSVLPARRSSSKAKGEVLIQSAP